MTTFVTGASGHVGANLVRELLARGERVRVLLRRGSNNAAVDGLDVECAYGDLRHRRSLEEAIDGCDYIYHVGALLSIRDGDQQELFDTNILGTRKLLETAKKLGVKRVVHCSSFSAIGHNWHGASNEDWVINPFESHLPYERSKAWSEYEVLRAVLQGLDVVIVNPSAVVGPWDFKPSLVGRAILDFAHGKIKTYVPGAFVFVPARDVVQGHILAMERGKTGERYLLTSEVVTIEQIFTWLAEFTGVPKPRIKIPPKLMQALAVVKDWIERKYFPQKTPRFNYHSIRLLNIGRQADNTKARRELGFQPTSVREAYREHVDWFQKYGFLTKRTVLRQVHASSTHLMDDPSFRVIR